MGFEPVTDFSLMYALAVNWYRTGEQNYKDDLAIVGQSIQVPVLFIRATYDEVLPSWMNKRMEKSIPNLTRAEVQSGHWALWQRPGECNAIIKQWIEEVVFGGKNKL
jgi:pimeloyl-ACP methyl ester carboxylesterase